MGDAGTDGVAKAGQRGRARIVENGVVDLRTPVTGDDADGGAGDDDLASSVPDVIVPLRHRNDGWTPIRQRAFLRALSELGSVTDACKRVGLSRTSARRLRDRSPDFAAAWDKAASIVAPILEQAAYERGVEGWDEPVYQGGKLVGYKRRYSDGALKLLMQPRGVAEADTGPGGSRLPDLATTSQDELEAFAHAAAKLAGGRFGTHKSQAEIDRLLMARLDALAARRQREREQREREQLQSSLASSP